jgi:hypothetical protein
MITWMGRIDRIKRRKKILVNLFGAAFGKYVYL